MAELTEKRCNCGSLLCKVNESVAVIQAKKGTAEIEPKGGSFLMVCICGRNNLIKLNKPLEKKEEGVISGTITRVTF